MLKGKGNKERQWNRKRKYLREREKDEQIKRSRNRK